MLMTPEEIAMTIAGELRAISKKDSMPISILCERGLFDLGIESVHLGHLLSTINNQFGVELSVTDFFDYPSVNKLAKHISHHVLRGGEC